MEKYRVFLGSDIAKTYSDAKKFTLERVNSFQMILISIISKNKISVIFEGIVFVSIGLLDDYHREHYPLNVC